MSRGGWWEEEKKRALGSDFFSSVSFSDKDFSFLFLEVYSMEILKMIFASWGEILHRGKEW